MMVALQRIIVLMPRAARQRLPVAMRHKYIRLAGGHSASITMPSAASSNHSPAMG
jgi:hypothetical protein